MGVVRSLRRSVGLGGRWGTGLVSAALLVAALVELAPLGAAQTTTTMTSTTQSTQDITTTAQSPISTTSAPVENCTREAEKCKDGLIISMWRPSGGLSDGDKAARATVYMAAMIYMFLGVSIIADRFMAAIEVITSQEKIVVVKLPSGSTTSVNVRIWNETVSNLTLMALGSSAPEILLSVIEICGNSFESGDLGPSTIVGSAAYNLFVITAICVSCLPKGEVRRIKHLRVFFITATWSVFAYLWLYFIISLISPGVVQVWEAALTLAFFPATVVTAYIADRKLLVYKFLSKKYRTNKGIIVTTEGSSDTELGDRNHVGDVTYKGVDSDDADIREFEQHRREYIEILRELRQKHPNVDMRTLEDMAEYEVVNRGPKSRAFYRIQATRKLTGGGNVIKKAKVEKAASVADVKVDAKDEASNITSVFFDPGHYTVMENVGTFYLTVSREGGNLNKTIYVDFKTEDGTANAGSDYDYAEGTLVFYPGETHKQFPVTIIDDDLFEEDEHFYVRLSNLRTGDSQGMFESGQGDKKVQLVNPFMATVMILDDDHPGIFHFDEKEITVHESIGEMHVKVARSSGARGTVKIPIRCMDGTAKSGKDYQLVTRELVFENDQTEAYIRVHIMDDEEYEKSETFILELDEPYLVVKGSDGASRLLSSKGLKRKAKGSTGSPVLNTEDERLVDMARPRLGDIITVTVTIKESMEFKSVVDKLLKKANVSLVVGTSSWREQFVDAITVNAGGDDDDDDEDAEEKLPSCMDYVMHFLTLFWKVLFACVPPTEYWGGWASFIVSIMAIGVLTALVGDLASGFGCTVGLKDAVTAISFVALGTSVPDTFASKVATIHDKYADSSIGNVTGSNAVNVFLGIGLAWTIASVYHCIKGSDFRVEAGSLAFSVTLFCCFALVTISIMMFRRRQFIGGELGGPQPYRVITTTFLVSMWITYIILSSLVAYCYIPEF